MADETMLSTKETFAGKFGTMECPACRQVISAGGAARTSHFRSHVRDGSMDETRDKKDGTLKFTLTGQTPVSKVERTVRQAEQWAETNTTRAKGVATIPRKPVKAEITKAGVFIHCRDCGKKNKATECGFDERLLRALCECGKLTLFQKRFTNKTGTVTA